VELYYIDRRLVERWPVEGGPSAGAVAAMLERRVVPDGMPVVLDGAMRPVEPLCAWMRHLAQLGRDPATMRAYAQITRRLAVFLEGRGTDLLSARDVDLVAFHTARTRSQGTSVSGVTWDKDRAAIKNLYTFLETAGYIKRRPYPLGAHRGPMGAGMSQEMRVRHMTLEQYRFFRDVGFAGLLPDGRVDPGFRGWAPHRNRAALEVALMTGMRVQEWSTVLLPELGGGRRRPGAGVEFTLQECAKYGLERRVWVPSAALDAVDAYLLLERPALVAKARRALERRRRDLFVVDAVDMERGVLGGVLDGARRQVAISAMTPQLRAAAVVEGEGGLEPLAVFLGHGARMLGYSRWGDVRRAAWRRLLAHADAPEAPDLPAAPWRFHDARHTFALQLLITLLDRSEQAAQARRSGEPVSSRDKATLFNAVIQVQRALGHLRISSTYHYLNYLEDPRSAIDEAFGEWAIDESATYAQIGRLALAGKAGPDA
jgi:integrase